MGSDALVDWVTNLPTFLHLAAMLPFVHAAANPHLNSFNKGIREKAARLLDGA